MSAFHDPASAGLEVPAPTGLEVVRTRHDIPVHQGIEVVPNQYEIPYKYDDAKELNPSQFPPKRRRICGLPFAGFWALIVIIAVVVLGAAIGGGVGGGLAAQRKNTTTNASDPDSSPSVTTTSSTSGIVPLTTTTSSSSPSATTSSTSGTVPLTTTTSSSSPSATTCPAVDGTTYAPLAPGTNQPYNINGTNLTYTIRCNTDYAGGSAYGNPGVTDLQILSKVDSLDACIGACATYTSQLVQTANSSAKCDAVGWLPSGSQCFLKNGVTSSSYNNTANLATYPVDSAIQAGS